MTIPAFFRTPSFLILLLTIISSYLIITNLDNSYLWQDEAETACVSRTILQEGIPKGFDGLNYFSQQEGREYGANYEWKLHPWFQFYWQALFFALFGVSTFTARLPFALLGIGSVVFLYFLALRVWKFDQKSALWSVALCLISVTFLLLVRQSRYYAAVQFFSIYAVWALFARFDGNKRYALLHYSIAGFFLFHSHYLFAMTLWLVAISYTFYAERQHTRGVLLATLVPAVVCLPFLWWLLDSAYGDTMTTALEGKQQWTTAIYRYAAFLSTYIFSPLWLAVPAGFWVLRSVGKTQLAAAWQSDTERRQVFLLGLILVNLLALSLLSQEFYGRYLGAVLPFAFLLKGHYLSLLHTLQRWTPFALFLLLLAIGDLYRYLPELHQTYRGPIGGIVQFLQQKAQPNDTIAITYGDLPLKFYLPDHKIYGGLTGEPLDKARRAHYLILRKNAISDMDRKVHQTLSEKVYWQHYQVFKLNVEDSPFENRETPDEHLFKTPKLRTPVLIYQRMQ